MDIHKQLKRIRQLSGLSQKKLGEKAHATQKQICWIEGGRDCYISTIRSILNVLGYDLAAVPIELKEGGQNADNTQGM